MEQEHNPELDINPKSVVIITTTFYPKWYPGNEGVRDADKIRGDLALKMIREANTRGFQVVVVDGAENQRFKDELLGFNINVFPEVEKGMSGSRQQGFKEASALEDGKVLCWVEPEKVSVVRDCLPQAVIPILKGDADVVVPQRNKQLFEETYPDYQVLFEKRSNQIWNAMLKKYGLRNEEDPELDVWFGPKFFRNDPDLVKLFTDKYSFTGDPKLQFHKIVRPELWSNATFLPVISALRKHLKVVGVEVSYRHPAEQTAFEQDSHEMRRKREFQQKNIILVSEFFIRKLLNLPSDTGRTEKVA
ncbi:MAG: hypothetical protein Q7R43_02490 [Candidatus Daviesbacteria bacterium]|nr:hypothetical protein [Candidatus Daviesbacteria bacterium]